MNHGTNKADDTTPATAARRDAGVTFIELLVSVVLLGTAGVAVLVATSAAVVGARRSDEISKAQQALAEAADYLTDTDPESVIYVPCQSGGVQAAYQASLDARFPGTVEVVDVRFWNRGSETFGGCVVGTPGYRLQEVDLRVVNGDAVRTITVIKRPADVPTAGADTGTAPAAPPYSGAGGNAVVSPTPWIGGTP